MSATQTLLQRLRALSGYEHSDFSVGAEAADEIERLQSELAAAPVQPEPVAPEVGEGWEALAWQLCADENGEDACNELVWEGGPIPEPWGDRWLKYEGEAKRMIALVSKHASPPPAQPATPQGDEKDWTEVDMWAEIYRLRAAVKGPEGYDSWQDAATAERIRRVKAEAAQPKREPLTDEQIEVAMYGCLNDWDWREFARAIERSEGAGIVSESDVGNGPNPLYGGCFEGETQELADLRRSQAAQIAALKTVMIAAAEEIAAHWEAHCDAEGYGPQNLLRRLEEGIPSEYGYTAGAFAALTAGRNALRAALESCAVLLDNIASYEDGHQYTAKLGAKGARTAIAARAQEKQDE